MGVGWSLPIDERGLNVSGVHKSGTSIDLEF